SAARSEHVNQLIAPALSRGKIVVCDRFTGSTIAYQGYGRGIDIDFIHLVNAQSTANVSALLTVLLDIPLEVGQARSIHNDRDVFEQEKTHFYKKVRDGYLASAASDPERWMILDGTASSEDLSEIIWNKVSKLKAEP
ncbi:dTMP kinase, partial [SAR202 cluster bacterium AD-804-J14_MRT_500m]|nr:dTMP kinase [SAR202 cluster bacterium AD-804-J14_MRT_500m]